MALEKRGGNYYYYKKERIGNRVVSKYYGKGELADLIAQMDEINRYEKEIEAENRKENLRELEKIDDEFNLFESKVNELTANTLLLLGFYKTKSREWRLKAK